MRAIRGELNRPLSWQWSWHLSRQFMQLSFKLFCALSPIAAYAEEGVTDKSILLGQTVGLTGIVAAPVREMNEGALAYFSEVNKQGGVFGRQIILQTLDDKFDPAITAVNAKRLINEEHIFAFFQGRGTPHTQAILPLLAQYGVPLFFPSTGAAVFHSPVNRWVFNVRPKYQDEVSEAIKYFSTLKLNKIGLLYVDDAFGLDALTGFKNTMASRQLPTNIVQKFSRVNPDYTQIAQTLVKLQPEALIIASSSKNTVEVIKALRKAGGNFQLLTLSNNSSAAFVSDLGSAGAGVIVSQVMPVPNLHLSNLATEFMHAGKSNKVTMSYASMEGYVNAKVLVEGLRRAGKDLTREKLVHALESIHRLDIGGIMIDYGPQDHSGSAYIELTMIGRDGKFIR